MVNEMIVIHNCLIRSLNAIYLQCIKIENSPQDVPNFVEYAYVWCKLIHEHHNEEETDVFPAIDKLTGVDGIMAGNVEQHRAFHSGVEHYETFLHDVKAGTTQYDGQKLKDIIDSFASTLHQHLVDEISTLLSLKQYSEKVDWAEYWRKKSAEIVKAASASPEAKVSCGTLSTKAVLFGINSLQSVFMPFVLSCHDPTFENGIVSWPEMPWIAKILFKWYFVPQHRAWWRFGPIDASGKPQELPFV